MTQGSLQVEPPAQSGKNRDLSAVCFRPSFYLVIILPNLATKTRHASETVEAFVVRLEGDGALEPAKLDLWVASVSLLSDEDVFERDDVERSLLQLVRSGRIDQEEAIVLFHEYLTVKY